MSEEIKMFNGGPAFPRPFSESSSGGMGSFGSYEMAQKGMSMRDWFAGMAMTGILASNPVGIRWVEVPWDKYVDFSYRIADLMVARRDKNES